MSRIAFRDVTNATNERTTVTAHLPKEAATGCTAPTIAFRDVTNHSALALLETRGRLIIQNMTQQPPKEESECQQS